MKNGKKQVNTGGHEKVSLPLQHDVAFART